MKHGHAMNPENIPWTGSEYKLAEQRRAKQSRIERKRTKHK